MQTQARPNLPEEPSTSKQRQGFNPCDPNQSVVLEKRRNQALETRLGAARRAFDCGKNVTHQNNGDEQRYSNFIGNFTKGLPHNQLGEVECSAYKQLLTALGSGLPEDFAAIPLCKGRKLVNPQAGLAFDLEGPDAWAVTVPPAPCLDSAEAAGEMGEVYWMALLRDVNFTDYGSHPLVAAAAADISQFSDFCGPKQAGYVTPTTIFRGITPGDRMGPYLSQFLLQGTQIPALRKQPEDGSIAYGTLRIDQRQKTAAAGIDYMSDYSEWLAVQNGLDTGGRDRFDSTPRFIRNFRDLATYVHIDQLYEAYLNACLILLEMKAPLDPGNPYVNNPTQVGFGTFGGPHVLSLVTEVATRALKAVWFQKWFVHRRLRPEAYGGLVHNCLSDNAKCPVHADILNSTAVEKVFSKFGTYLLPMAFPEGSPTHPAYGAGHATVAGACVTILKAWFKGDCHIPNPVVPNAEGTELLPYGGPQKDQLTLEGELNKLAANISIGRNGAGVHWRTDYTASIEMGEAIAIGILKDQLCTYNEDYCLSLIKFDGQLETISNVRC